MIQEETLPGISRVSNKKRLRDFKVILMLILNKCCIYLKNNKCKAAKLAQEMHTRDTKHVKYIQ